MSASYTFNYLNSEGGIIKVVGIMCADDQAASLKLSQFRPDACVDAEMWSDDRQVCELYNEEDRPGH
jgi:hypothetical protein